MVFVKATTSVFSADKKTCVCFDSFTVDLCVCVCVQSKFQKHQAFEAELAANAERLQTLLGTGQSEFLPFPICSSLWLQTVPSTGMMVALC